MNLAQKINTNVTLVLNGFGHLFFIFRFVADEDNFETAGNNQENACFCENSSGSCSKYSGLFNVSRCHYGAPVLISSPHFFQVCETFSQLKRRYVGIFWKSTVINKNTIDYL